MNQTFELIRYSGFIRPVHKKKNHRDRAGHSSDKRIHPVSENPALYTSCLDFVLLVTTFVNRYYKFITYHTHVIKYNILSSTKFTIAVWQDVWEYTQ